MPTYGYQCTECKYEFSAFQSMKDDPIAVCPQCSGKVKRLLYPVGVVFKGTGWYINDSRAPEKSEKSDSAARTENGDKTETPASVPESSSASKPAATDSKPEASAAVTSAAPKGAA